LRFLLKALTRTPLPVLYAWGWLLHVIVFHVVRWRRDQVASDIARAFPDKSPAERARILRQSYRNIADVVMESIWGFGASAEKLAQRVTFENTALVDDAVAARQSVVLLTPHFCNWEWLLPAGGARFGLPIDAVYQKQRIEVLDQFLLDARSRFGGKPIVREDFVYELMHRAGTPRGYALIADQTPPRDDKKHWSRFLNRDTAFFIGAEKVARFLDSPVLYVAMRRVGRGRYSVRLLPLAMPPFDAEAAGDVTPIMESFARKLEAAIRESPADWLWLQKRWKYPKPDLPETQPRRRRKNR
jgi:Kdo2-lipid IVA lauroyltransferase/acyltransferase